MTTPWKLYASRREKAVHAIKAGPAVVIGKIVTNRIKWIERYPLPLRPFLEEFVKHHLPSSGMQARRVGQHAVKIKDRCIELTVLDCDRWAHDIQSRHTRGGNVNLPNDPCRQVDFSEGRLKSPMPHPAAHCPTSMHQRRAVALKPGAALLRKQNAGIARAL